jgi:hypothetical protein
MYETLCLVYYMLHYTLHIIQCIPYTIFQTNNILCMLYIIYNIFNHVLYIIYYLLYLMYHKLYIIYNILHDIYYTIYYMLHNAYIIYHMLCILYYMYINYVSYLLCVCYLYKSHIKWDLPIYIFPLDPLIKIAPIANGTHLFIFSHRTHL